MSSVLDARRVAASTLALGAVGALSGCGVLTGLLGGNVLSVEVGDCFVVSDMEQSLSEGAVTDVPLVDCDEPHDGEFFYAEDLPDGDYPGEVAVDEQAMELCEGQAFTDFVGADYMTSEIWTSYLVPTEESWDRADDREILCYLETMETVTGSQEGAGI